MTIQDHTTEYQQLELLRTEQHNLVSAKSEMDQVNESLQASLLLHARHNQKLQTEVAVRKRAEDELRTQAADLIAAKTREAEQRAGSNSWSRN